MTVLWVHLPANGGPYPRGVGISFFFFFKFYQFIATNPSPSHGFFQARILEWVAISFSREWVFLAFICSYTLLLTVPRLFSWGVNTFPNCVQLYEDLYQNAQSFHHRGWRENWRLLLPDPSFHHPIDLRRHWVAEGGKKEFNLILYSIQSFNSWIAPGLAFCS